MVDHIGQGRRGSIVEVRCRQLDIAQRRRLESALQDRRWTDLVASQIFLAGWMSDADVVIAVIREVGRAMAGDAVAFRAVHEDLVATPFAGRDRAAVAGDPTI